MNSATLAVYVHNIDPYIFTIFGVGPRWYGMSYLLGFLIGGLLIYRVTRVGVSTLEPAKVLDLVVTLALGIIIGGRLGYVTFYEPGHWTDFSGDGFVSWKVLRVWDGGMSFHGGLIGTVLAIAWVSWRGGLPFIRVADYISVNVGFGMMFGRLANFINGELWGRPAGEGVPWAMTFCDRGRTAAGECLSTFVPRHPSQLYEAALEGLLVVIVMLCLFWLTRARYRPALLVGVFTTLIASGRFIVEFFREPDAQLAEFAAETGLNMGQWLTIPLILLGLGLVVYALKRAPLASGAKQQGTSQAEAN